jgi:hypothetical protein
VLADEYTGYPCLFVFVTPRKIVGDTGFVDYSFAERANRDGQKL